MIKPAWVFVDFMVQDKLGNKDYGLYAALFSLSFLFINLADMGVNQFVTRYITSNPKEKTTRFFSNAFTFKILASIFYPFFITLIGYIIGYRAYELYYLFLLGMVQSVLQFVAFIRANFQALQLFNIDAFASVADKILLLFGVLIVLGTGISLFVFIHTILLTVFITSVILLIILSIFQGWIAPKFDKAEMKSLIVKSFPFAIIGLLYAINQRIDMVMVERLGGDNGMEQAGLYAASYRWMDAFMMFLWTVLPIFFAKFSAQQFELEEQQKLFDIGQIICFIPLLYIGTVIFFYGKNFFWMFHSITTEELEQMTLILKVLFFSVMIQGMFAIYGTLLNATGHEKKVSVMILISLTVNVLLNFIFIPVYGAIAAAVTSLTSTTLICFLYVFYFYKNIKLNIPVYLLRHLILISILFSSFFYILTLGSFHWLLNCFLAGIVLLVLVFIFLYGKIKFYLKS